MTNSSDIYVRPFNFRVLDMGNCYSGMAILHFSNEKWQFCHYAGCVNDTYIKFSNLAFPGN
jgi:hypothetical protein